MTDDAQLIKAALERRFARADTPPCPDGAWHATTAAPARNSRFSGVPRGFAYAAALLALVGIGGIAAQASSSNQIHDLPFLRFFVSSKPLPPGIHAADRLTIAQAQRRIPFPIFEPTALPADTHLDYAAVGERPKPRVTLNYQAHIAGKYYRIAFDESTVPHGPSRARLDVVGPGHVRKVWDFPIRRFKHGALFVNLYALGLPEAMQDRIVQANTM